MVHTKGVGRAEAEGAQDSGRTVQRLLVVGHYANPGDIEESQDRLEIILTNLRQRFRGVSIVVAGDFNC